MALHFEKYAEEGRHFMKEVAEAIGSPGNLDKAGRVFRATVHVFRDRTTPAESLNLISQLPMLVKAIYVDGWRIGHQTRILRNAGDFIEAMREAGGTATQNDFVSDYDAMKAIQGVFKVLQNHVSGGEINDVLGTWPPSLRDLMEVGKR